MSDNVIDKKDATTIVTEQEEIVLLAKIGAPYGIKGFNHIQSFTDPLDNILTYKNILIGRKGHWRKAQLSCGRLHNKSVVAKFEHISDRDQAQQLTGQEIAVLRSELPDTDGYYWVDLEGLTVVTQAGELLGKVAYLYEIADNANMLVIDQSNNNKERHIPFIEPDFVTKVCFETKQITVDWEPSH